MRICRFCGIRECFKLGVHACEECEKIVLAHVNEQIETLEIEMRNKLEEEFFCNKQEEEK